jgi:hypothetical protein
MAKANLTAEQARRLLAYEASSGEILWRSRPASDFTTPKGWKIYCTRYAGKRAGSACKQTGYLTIRVLGHLYQAHRIVWLLNCGVWPSNHIDHINGDKLDNRIENLRDVVNSQNRQNMKAARVDSVSGIHGVRLDPRNGRYVALVRHAGKSWSLGSFATSHEARCARIRVKAYLHASWVPSREDAELLSDVGGPVSPLHFQGRARSDSRSGVRGVSRCGSGWRAMFGRVHIGVFSTIDAAKSAHVAYCATQGDIP